MLLEKKESKVLIVSHFLINPLVNAASSTSIRNFLLHKIRKVIQIEQPFPESKERNSFLLIFEDGKLKNRIKAQTFNKPAWHT